VTSEVMAPRLIHGDCMKVMQGMDSGSVDLVLCSPPYADARDYGIGFNLRGSGWVNWAVERYVECLRVSKGLVAWVVEGVGQQTVDYTGEPILMQAKLIEMGIPIWKPSIYGRFSLPGRYSVLRNNYEFVVMSSNGRKLEYSDPTACGSAPKCKPGGRTRPRAKDGSRNQSETDYKQPGKTNHGNIIWCGAVGGGNMGHELATENEAPFPEFLAEVIVKSFCPPGGTVLDCFCGSGTTVAVSLRNGRNAIGIDVRESQIELTNRRVRDENS
jgi:hypothetical protein